MGYRGEDLDLRTPQTWSATPSDLATDVGNGNRGYRTGPILVDDTVLACCNYAYDIALAHRAGDVRIEHLLHAMTRIDSAADALEARGVRVAALRRESATIIASEIPVGLPNGKGSPRRSEELVDVLRAAATTAGRRNGPASVDDLLNVLFEPRIDQATHNLLTRNLARTVVREVVEPVTTVRYVQEPRYVTRQVEVPRPVERYIKTEAEPRYVTETIRQEPVRQEPPRPVYREPLNSTDTQQNNRIEALEQMVRNLGTDLANERQVMAGLLKDLSRDAKAQRDDQGRLQSGLYDRLQTLEQALAVRHEGGGGGEQFVAHVQQLGVGLDQQIQDMGRMLATVTARLGDIERTLRDQESPRIETGPLFERLRDVVDLKPISNRLDIIEEAVLSRDYNQGPANDVADRLSSLEGAIARALASNTASTGRMESLIGGFERQKTDFVAPVMERVTALGQMVDSHGNASQRVMSALVDRLDQVERAVAAEIETAAAKHQAYAQDLGEVHDALMKLNQNQHTLAGSIDQWRSEAAGDITSIASRLANLDRDNERPIETLNALTAHMDTMNRMFVERYHRRNRFWYWLFGTDDWIGRSWPSQVAAIETDQTRLKAPRVPG